jgi:hypothetical protein
MFSLRYYRFLLQSYLNQQALHLFQFQLFIKWLRNLLFAQQFSSFLSFALQVALQVSHVQFAVL